MQTWKFGDKIDFWIQRGTLVLPPNEIPVILIGPGTGVAPIRSFLQDRIAQNINENVLFFGCRGKDKDFLYGDEFKCLDDQGKLKLITAFSRDQTNKDYVQHKILEKKELVWNLLKDKNAIIILSGNAKRMPEDVADALKTVCIKEGGMTERECEIFMHDLEINKRFQQE
ncbi:NADPH-dependent diflavin oxidoreductase 1, partial [Nowakowskiella sp. JEL0078]